MAATDLISRLDVQGVSVCLTVDGDRFDAQLLAGAHDSAGNLATVSDQNLVEQLLASGADVADGGHPANGDARAKHWWTDATGEEKEEADFCTTSRTGSCDR
jgi:hypothetical protein